MASDYIILAGSDLQFLELLAEKLKALLGQHEIFISHDAFEVYRKIQSRMPVLVLLEMVFPQWDWDGYMLLKFFKRDSALRRMKSVLIADNPDGEMRDIAQDKDIDKVLFKNQDMESILQEIRKMIQV